MFILTESDHRMKKRSIKRTLCIGLAASFVLGITACGTETDDEPRIVVASEQEKTQFQAATVVRADLSLTKSVSCTLKSQQETGVFTGISGRQITKILVSKGDQVKTGDLLLMLGEESLEGDIEELEYMIERNRILLSYTDESDLYQREDLEDRIYIDSLRLEELKSKLLVSRVYAPADGVITWIRSGILNNTVKENEQVMTVTDEENSIFIVKKDNYSSKLSKDEPVKMHVNIGKAAGDYELIPIMTEKWGDELYYELSPEYADADMPMGTTGYITVVIDERKGALKLPLNAIHTAGDKAFCYVPGENGIRSVRWIETGLEGDDGVEIVSGLSEGEVVLK